MDDLLKCLRSIKQMGYRTNIGTLCGGAADTITALRAERDAAYRKGAEDMREQAAVEIETRDGAIPDRQEIAAAIRKLEPIP